MYDLNSTIGPIIVEGVAIIAYYILGKIAVDDAILLKPGRFTHDECEEMETHASEGVQAQPHFSPSVQKSLAPNCQIKLSAKPLIAM